MKKQTATQKLRKQVKDAVRRREKKGWYVPEELKQQIDTKGYQFLKSLHDRGYRKLDESIQVEDTLTGEMITGQQAKVRSRWNFEERARKKLASDMQRMYQNPEFQHSFSEGAIVAQRIEDLIQTLQRYNDPFGNILYREYYSAIAELGEEAVYYSLAKNFDRLMEDIDVASKYHKGLSYHDEAILDIVALMNDNLMTPEEIHDLAVEAEEYDMFDEFQVMDLSDVMAIADEYKQAYGEFTEAEVEERAKNAVQKGREKSGTKTSLFDLETRDEYQAVASEIWADNPDEYQKVFKKDKWSSI